MIDPRMGRDPAGRDPSPRDPFAAPLPAALELVPSRPLVVHRPIIRIALAPGDRVLVREGEIVVAGTPIAERTVDAVLVDVGHLDDDAESAKASEASEPDGESAGTDSRTARLPDGQGDRRVPPFAGKWWIGGERRRGRLGRHYLTRKVAGTLLYEVGGRWHASAGERHEIVEAPVEATVRSAVSDVEITLEVAGSAIPAAVAAGEPARGRLDYPETGESDLRSAALDVGRAGAIVVAGSRTDAESMTRARAMGIRGVIAASISSGDLRDLAASEARQRASLHTLAPFAALGFDGYLRRPIPTPLSTLLRSLAGREVAVSLDPPLLLFDAGNVALPEVPPDWVRVRSGGMSGREGRWAGAVGLRLARPGIHLEMARVRFEDEEAIVPVNDLERLVV